MNTLKIIIKILFVFCVAAANASSSKIFETSSMNLTAGSGHLDSVEFFGNKITASGWVLPVDPAINATKISIFFGGEIVYEGKFIRFQREDVALAMGRPDRLNSGWRASFSLPERYKKGHYSVTAVALLDNGKSIALNINDAINFVDIPDVPRSEIHDWITVIGVVLLIFIVLATLVVESTILSRLNKSSIRRFPEGAIPVFAVLILFVFLILSGTTGSSIGIGINATPFVSADGHRLVGSPKGIRSDEWLVMTPLSIAQSKHVPSLPIVNKNIGEDGHNMLVVGMTGAPVNHMSTLAKPATWGFHLFDLRRALAWYWWFPIFACFLALWWACGYIFGGYSRSGFLISLIFCSSPYVVAWSNWPAYAVFFPALALCAGFSVINRSNFFSKIFFGIVFGLSLAGFFLILYPPWQITLGYLFLAVGVSIFIRDKLYSKINRSSMIVLLLGVALTGGVLWCWWLDAANAIIAITKTVYPGQRVNLSGGGQTIDYLLRGYTNIISLYNPSGTYSNESEFSSFNYYFIPLAALFLIKLFRREVALLHWVILIYISLLIWYSFLGVPDIVSSITLFGRVPVPRMDLALGLSQLFLVGLLLTSAKNGEFKFSCETRAQYIHVGFAAISAFAWSIFVFYSLSRIPSDYLKEPTPGILCALFVFVLISSWWLAIGDGRKFLILTLIQSLIVTLAFNPLSIAPASISYDKELIPVDDGVRVIVAETQIPAMFVLAAGVSAANGIFYYPQKEMWSRLDPGGRWIKNYNRYQHLIVKIGAVEAPYFSIENPQQDVIRITVDPDRFDFKLLGASVLLIPSEMSDALKNNQSVSFLANKNNWHSFLIKK